MQLVIVLFAHHYERTVLGVEPTTSSSLQVKPELEAAGVGQLTEQFVAEPIVASVVAESELELHPRTVEEVGTVEVLLD